MIDQPQENGGYKAVAIITAVIGGIALAGAGTTAAFGAVHSFGAAGDHADSVNAEGITELDVDGAASSVSIRFGDVDEAELAVTGSDDRWRLERDGDELTLRNPDQWWGWGGDWLWFGGDERDTHVELVLPRELSGIDADFSLGAGSLEIEGDFGDVDAEVGAGALTMDGAATSIDVDVSAGRADLTLVDVDEADLTVSAGKLVVELADTAPRDVTIEVSAGSLELTLPDEAYNLSQNVSAGSLDNGLRTSNDSSRTIDAQVSAGSAVLRAQD